MKNTLFSIEIDRRFTLFENRGQIAEDRGTEAGEQGRKLCLGKGQKGKGKNLSFTLLRCPKGFNS
ncbi:hypothetical protein A6770_15780 [Nostoc minutum NIES-26]|uniref:Uncharacterized protein n=1 Tax=Nostoc minutum NIES-26 TaxID=1844469 RepID=A0A367RLF9_9NOSO|nr:hypothetical protein A6770_15780 [Nostoc minutum NIES-26]